MIKTVFFLNFLGLIFIILPVILSLYFEIFFFRLDLRNSTLSTRALSSSVLIHARKDQFSPAISNEQDLPYYLIQEILVCDWLISSEYAQIGRLSS